jgi:hypothetical protein
MTYIFDIDGTICTNTFGDYENATPLEKRIELVNELYDEGNTIHLLTARGMGRSNNAVMYADRAFRKLTEKQLKQWGVKYHRLFLGKPAGDFYIDDKGIKDEDFFNTRD